MSNCPNNKTVVVEECDEEVCPINIEDRCIQNTIVDVDFGINGLMNSRDVILVLMNRINELQKEFNKIKNRL